MNSNSKMGNFSYPKAARYTCIHIEYLFKCFYNGRIIICKAFLPIPRIKGNLPAIKPQKCLNFKGNRRNDSYITYMSPRRLQKLIPQ